MRHIDFHLLFKTRSMQRKTTCMETIMRSLCRHRARLIESCVCICAIDVCRSGGQNSLAVIMVVMFTEKWLEP